MGWCGGAATHGRERSLSPRGEVHSGRAEPPLHMPPSHRRAGEAAATSLLASNRLVTDPRMGVVPISPGAQDSARVSHRQ